MDQPPVLESLSRVLVTFPRLGTQVVLIPGGFVLTAAHCLMDEKDRTPYPHKKAFTPFSMAFTARNSLVALADSKTRTCHILYQSKTL